MSGLAALDVIGADLARTRGRKPPTDTLELLALLTAIPTAKAVAVLGFRLAHAAGRRLPLLGAAIKQLTQIVTGCDIDYRATIGPGLYLPHPSGVVVAGGTVIGARCTLNQGVTLGSRPEGSPSLGDDVALAPGCRVIGPIAIGDMVQVGANSVVTRSFGEGHVVLVGVPAEVLRSH